MYVDVQAKLPPVLAAIQNFIKEYDAEDIQELLDCDAADQATLPEYSRITGYLALGPARTAEQQEADSRRDWITSAMWQQYQAKLRQRGVI